MAGRGVRLLVVALVGGAAVGCSSAVPPAKTSTARPPAARRVVIFEDGQLQVLEPVRFLTASSDIQPEAYEVLVQVAETLELHPEIRRLTIEGHTDDTGTREYNQALSLQRAEAVRSFLISKGIEEGRLEVAGHGPDRPELQGQHEAARALNRRVEFVLAE